MPPMHLPLAPLMQLYKSWKTRPLGEEFKDYKIVAARTDAKVNYSWRAPGQLATNNLP